MATIKPFRALHYNPAAVSNLAAVIAPPYDVIDDAHWQRLHDRDPHNIVRLILNRDGDRYASAAQALSAWWRAGVLAQDERPAFYYYVQNFTLPELGALERRGLIAAVRLEPFGAGSIYPHERTFEKAKEDRLRLVDACRTNLSPIFGVYAHHAETGAAAERARAAQVPWIDLTDEVGERHRVWRIDDPATVEAMTASLAQAPVFIADGHHRYEVALAYRNRRNEQGDTNPNAPHNFVLMYLGAMEDSGLVILPTHRVLRRLPDRGASTRDQLGRHFTSERYPHTAEGLAAMTAALEAADASPSVGVCVKGDKSLELLRLREGVLDDVLGNIHPTVRRLGVSVLDALVLRQILGIDCTAAAQAGELRYTHRDVEAVDLVDRGEAAAAFLMRPPSMREVEAVCLAGETMPEKSTYFYPKLLSGLVLHALDDPPRLGAGHGS
jgi:uncharacterized protein (DUF1015 family)